MVTTLFRSDGDGHPTQDLLTILQLRVRGYIDSYAYLC